MTTGIYEIKNTVNGKRYIGSAVSTSHRFSQHLHRLRHNKHHSPHLQSAFNLYGEESFVFTVLYECPREELIRCEQKEIDALHPEYNATPMAGSRLGSKVSEETKKKLSEYRGVKSSSFGKHLSDETKEKLSIAHKGKKYSKEYCEEMSKRMMGDKNPNFGKTRSDEFKRMVSLANTGRKHTEEELIKISKASTGHAWNGVCPMLGKHHTEETKKKMSESGKGKHFNKKEPMSQETKDKLSASRIALFKKRKAEYWSDIT